jgi:hypothetical protein
MELVGQELQYLRHGNGSGTEMKENVRCWKLGSLNPLPSNGKQNVNVYTSLCEQQGIL